MNSYENYRQMVSTHIRHLGKQTIRFIAKTIMFCKTGNFIISNDQGTNVFWIAIYDTILRGIRPNRLPCNSFYTLFGKRY